VRLRERLAGVILLGGTIRATDLSRGLDRLLVDLPVEPGLSVLDLWVREIAALAALIGVTPVPARLLVDASSPEPRDRPQHPGVGLRVERDRGAFRGTGGVLRDACGDYADGSLVLVANANQVLIEPLAEKSCALASAGGDIAVMAHDDGAPVGLMLVSVAAVRAIRSVGYVDFKEQALPRLASRFDVRVVRSPSATAAPIRTLDAYLRALRAYHRIRARVRGALCRGLDSHLRRSRTGRLGRSGRADPRLGRPGRREGRRPLRRRPIRGLRRWRGTAGRDGRRSGGLGSRREGVPGS
jgi:hypothetical protein